eukprot:269355-Prymnesium_polylepis.3
MRGVAVGGGCMCSETRCATVRLLSGWRWDSGVWEGCDVDVGVRSRARVSVCVTELTRIIHCMCAHTRERE